MEFSPWNSPGQNSGVGSLPLLQGIFPTQESNPGLLHCRWILYQLSHKGNLIGKCQFTADRRKGWRILQVRYLAVVNNINSDQFRVKALLGKCIHTLSFIIINLNASPHVDENLICGLSYCFSILWPLNKAFSVSKKKKKGKRPINKQKKNQWHIKKEKERWNG